VMRPGIASILSRIIVNVGLSRTSKKFVSKLNKKG